MDRLKCITFDLKAQDSLPQHIKDKMKVDRDNARKIRNMEEFNGKAIYNPSGKAGEYSYWACNFYVGCSNGCTYCYLKTGVLNHAMGGDVPTLKKCFKDEAHALKIFEKELLQNVDELRKHGLFFTFTSDPMLPETIELTGKALLRCLTYDVPVKILSKIGDFEMVYFPFIRKYLTAMWIDTSKIAFGFTLTGHDELEPSASTNADRIESMNRLHEAGFKTFASIEPIIDFESSERMIAETKHFCDLYKIGLKGGDRYSKDTIIQFMNKVNFQLSMTSKIPKVYWKDSLLKQAGVNRSELPENCVNRDYNLFKNNMEKEQLYFLDEDSKICYPLQHHIDNAKSDGLTEIELFEAVPDGDDPDFVWCSELENAVDRKECNADDCPYCKCKKDETCELQGILHSWGEKVKFNVEDHV